MTPSNARRESLGWRVSRNAALVTLCWNFLCGLTPRAQASFHLWTIQEIYSSADRSVQFIEFGTSANSQQFVANRTIRAIETAAPRRTNTFIFPGNTGSPTANKTFLVATPGFGALPGGVAPDFVIPTGFLFHAGGAINFAEGAQILNHGALPQDGMNSVNAGGTPGLNSPRNFAGNQGSVNVPPPPQPPVVSTNLPLSGIRVVADEVELSWASSVTEKYDVVFADALSATTQFRLAEANILPSEGGTNVFTDPPFFASPLFPPNEHLFYALEIRPNTATALPVELEIIATNLVAPTSLTHAGDGSGRLFVTEQNGQILIVDSNRNLLTTPFLDITNRIDQLAPNGIGGNMDPGLNPIFDERGLLGLAFHPDYENNGRFFIYYSSPKDGPDINHESIVAEYAVSGGDPDVADTNEIVILRQDEPQFNHNGGTLGFGPDGYLYIAFGDGGGANDGLDGSPGHGAFGNGQNVSNLLGTICRIDVDSASPYAVPLDNPFVGMDGEDEIYAYGFRNPFKFSFDRGGSNILVVADVGQNKWEEISFVRKGGNYGWRILEGNHAFDPDLLQTLGLGLEDLEFPIHEYHHDIGGISVIGGHIYRGTNYPELAGCYLFGDFSSSFFAPDGMLFYLEESRPGIWERFEFFLAPTNPPLGRYVKSFGEGEDGEVYLLSTTELGPVGISGDVRLLKKP